ncbi:MAG: VOC family protein [Spirochaetes bacterium]|nr:VOC family protein [Spirochaetota bacterium]
MKISFITIYTNDIKASVEFYEDVLDFNVVRQFSPQPHMEIIFMDDKHGNQIEFIHDKNEKPYTGCGLSIGFYVPDIEKIEKHLKNKNVEIVFGPVTMPSGVKIIHAKDINGVELGFVQTV